jgi:hypothetical protein
LFKDVATVHVNSRPWSVKDNKQLLKPREMGQKRYFKPEAQSKHPYLSDYKQVFILKYFKLHITILNIS